MSEIGTTVRSPMGAIEVAVMFNGAPQPIYRRTDGMLFVGSGLHQPYTLRVRNLTATRVEVISTVDGRHTLKDEPGDPEQNRGLVIAAHAVATFTGWRLNNDETRQFVFGEPTRSVAAQATGSAGNTGVIGFAAYREREWLPSYYASNTVSTASYDAAFGSAAPVMRGLGTGMGERQQDHVGTTSFTRAIGAADILVIGYDTETALRAMGVMGPPEPNAFPGVGTGYERYQAMP